MSLREFNDVGRIIGEFASEDATIKIGTALDPDLADEVRVTVVATGLNRLPNSQTGREQRNVRNNMRVVSGFEAPAPTPAAQSAFAPVLPHRQAGINTPTSQMQTAPATANIRRPLGNAAAMTDKQIELLNIPAFLRQQAD